MTDAALGELRSAGLIRRLGVSGVTVQQLDEALAIAPVVCVQNRYSLETRLTDGLEVLRACAGRGIAFVPFFAIAGGRHQAAQQRATDEAVQAVAQAHGTTPAQVRRAWTLHQGPHVLAIPGTGRVDHLKENIAAGALRVAPPTCPGWGPPRRADQLRDPGAPEG